MARIVFEPVGQGMKRKGGRVVKEGGIRSGKRG